MVSNRIIKIDLNKKTKNVVQMVQGDTNRKLTINVFDSDEPYLVNGVGGETIHGAVYIEKPDGTTCGYDTLEDDSPAVTGSGNTLTVYFVPQATTAHGWAYMTVSVFDDDGVELNTFGIDLFIDKKATATISADYWNLKSIEGLTAAVEGLTQQMVRSVNLATPDSNGNVSLLPWQLPYNGVVGGQQVGDVEEALDGLARMQAEIISQEIKDALVNALSHVAWTDEHGQDYVDALEQAMRSKLVSISAVFNQGTAVIYDTDDLDTLRQYLTVTAHYSDTTTRTVTAYTLSGTLEVGTSTITASYGGKTTTFDVVVTHEELMLNDILTLDGIKNTRTGHDASATTWEDLSGNRHDFAAQSGATLMWGDSYAKFDATNRAMLCSADLQESGSNLTIEFVVKVDGNGSYDAGTAYQGMLFTNQVSWNDTDGQFKFYSYRTGTTDSISTRYGSTSLGATYEASTIHYIAYVFNGTTVTRYVNGELAGTVNVTYPAGTKRNEWNIGGIIGLADREAYFNGKIYRIGVSKIAMTAVEIAQRHSFFASRFSIS